VTATHLEPLLIHTADTLATILRNQMAKNMRRTVTGVTIARSRGQRYFNVPMSAYGAALTAWADIWQEVHQVVMKWVEKLDESGIEACDGCVLNNIEELFRQEFFEQSGTIMMEMIEGEDTFEAPSPDDDVYEALKVILESHSHEH
jgi:hypothetical protein